MTIKFHRMPTNILAGITLKDEQEKEQFNMALHSCQNPQDILTNRGILAQALHIPLDRFVFANQTHSANFKKITEAHCGAGVYEVESAIENTDALYTFEKNIVLTSMTADCVPITFYSEEQHIIGAIHSGWSGTVKEITLHLFHHLKQNEHIDLTKVYVHIGYSICADKFEVDEDVAQKFENLGYAQPYIEWRDETKKFHIDNQYVIQKQLELAGVPLTNITIDRECTYSLKEGFSYRQDRNCGRHVSFIVQRED